MHNLSDSLFKAFAPLFWPYQSLCRGPLRMLDHNVVYVVRTYKLDLKRMKAEQRFVPAGNASFAGIGMFSKMHGFT